MRAMLAPLSVPTFRRVWLGQVANVVGDAVYAVAIALYLLPRPDAPRALGLVLGMAALGGVVSLLVGGVLADWYRRSVVIIVSDVVRAAAVAGILFVGQDAPLWSLGALAALLGIGSGLYRPAYGAILPSLVPREMLPGANGLRSLVNRVGVIVGAAVGGALAGATSPGWALAVDMATFLVSIATLVGVHEDAPRARDRADRSLVADVGDGLRYVFSRPWMAGIMLQGTAQMALVAAPVALLLPLLTGPQGWFGWITAAEAVGAFAGASAGASVRTRSRGWLAMLALFAQLPQTVALALHAPPLVILLASVLTGGGLATFAVVWTTALQTGVPREQLGRVFSVDQLAVAGLMPVGFVMAGWLLDGIGQSALAWLATVALAASILAVLPLPGLRRLTDEPRAGVAEPVPNLAS
ncbi:MAG TPA: MFS transporter [Actinophytocola sp.]|jgi:MFS family permease|nr:MFS transporter [Actinophytocola sp.]